MERSCRIYMHQAAAAALRYSKVTLKNPFPDTFIPSTQWLFRSTPLHPFLSSTIFVSIRLTASPTFIQHTHTHTALVHKTLFILEFLNKPLVIQQVVVVVVALKSG